MPSNINDFDKDLRLFAEVKVPGDHLAGVKKVAMQVLAGVVNKTPVDTGRARSNWMTAVNAVPSETVEISASLSREQATAESINRGTGVIDSAKPFSSISIANNLPYIGTLEYGGSKQAPNGMVRTTLAELEGKT
jgi:predicted phage gp36 major capsid-like protein